MEIWKDIRGYEGLYQVSNTGRIRSLDRYIKHSSGNGLQIMRGRVIKLKLHNGYYFIGLHKDGKCITRNVHRLVAEAFICNPENKPCIDHINTIKTDNRVENLRWCTQLENINNPATIKKMKINHHLKNQFGKLHPYSKPVLQFSLTDKFIKKWDCGADIERELGYKNGYISNCCNGKKEKAYNFKWKKLEDIPLLQTSLPIVTRLTNIEKESA